MFEKKSKVVEERGKERAIKDCRKRFVHEKYLKQDEIFQKLYKVSYTKK